MGNPNIDKYLVSVVESVGLLHENGLMGQLLTVIYSTIDACGLLDAPDNVDKATGATFKAWANKYLLSDSSIECSAEDLWGARCGVLHTHTSESDLSKNQRIKEIQYVSGPPAAPLVEAFIEAAKDIDDGKHVGVNVDILVMDFLKGISSFSKELAVKVAESEKCQERAGRVLQCFAM